MSGIALPDLLNYSSVQEICPTNALGRQRLTPLAQTYDKD